MTQPLPRPSLDEKITAGEQSATHTMRALIGWFNEQEAMHALLGRMANPLDDVVALREKVAPYRQAVATRPAFRVNNPVIEMKSKQLEAELLARPDLQAHFAGLRWRPAMVNLKKVLSYQRVIDTSGLDERIETAKQSEEALFELCLPQEPALQPEGVTIDPDQRGFTITSLNPNLHLAGYNIGSMPIQASPGVPPKTMLAISILVETGKSYVQVAKFQGRYILRDGYHRGAALMRAGITTVPCILIEANSLEELGLKPGLFAPEIFLSNRPPRLEDFWDDAVACDVVQPAHRKVARVQSSEFVVPR